MTNKDKILIGLIVILILLLIGSHLKNQYDRSKMFDQIQEANKHVLKLDKVKKEADGQYAKLVNNYKTEKDLKRELKKRNNKLYSRIKNQNEDIIMLNRTVISLKSERSTGDVTVDPIDSNSLDLNLRYPESDTAFIKWTGSISLIDNKYEGDWTFNKFPIEIVLTETQRGLWNSRLIGPDWLSVDSMTVNSLPKNKIADDKTKSFGFMLGGGISNSLNVNEPSAIRIGGGIYFKNSTLLINASTRNIVGLEYYHRFKKIKNK